MPAPAPHNGSETDEQDLSNPGVFVGSVIADAKGWVEAQKKYTGLVVSERLGQLTGALLTDIVLAALFGSALLMCSLALGLYLGELLGSTALGLLLLGVAYLLAALIFLGYGKGRMRDRVTLYIINTLRDEDPLS